jgi:hypothetical protein
LLHPAAARNRRRAERGRKPRDGRGAPEGDRARGRGERRRRGGGHGSDGRRERCRDGAVRARRCALADRGRSDRRLFPLGRRSADRSGSRTKKRTRKNPETDPFWDRARSFPTTPLERPFSSSHRQSIGPLRAVPRNRPLPTTKPPLPTKRVERKNNDTTRSGRRRTPRAHTSPRAARPTLTPSSSLSLSACVPSPRSCSRSSPAPREAAEPRATTAVERRRHRGGVLGARFFQTAPRGGARARPRREGAGIVTIGRD